MRRFIVENKTIDQSEHQEACMLWRAGDIPVAEQPPEAVGNIYITAVRFQPFSERRAAQRVIAHIEEFERGFCAKMVLAGRDRNFPLYSTVMAARYGGTSELERSLMFRALRCDPQLVELCEAFRDAEINYAELRLGTDGTIVLIADIPDDFRKPMTELRETYEHYCLAPIMANRLEITAGRVVRFPQNQWHREHLVYGLDYFLGEREVRKGLKLMTSNETVNGSLYDFLG